MRIIAVFLLVLVGMLTAIVGAGIVYAAGLLQSRGVPRRYASSRSTIHDSYYTIDPFGFLPMNGFPNEWIGWILLCASFVIFGVAVFLIKAPERRSAA